MGWNVSHGDDDLGQSRCPDGLLSHLTRMTCHSYELMELLDGLQPGTPTSVSPTNARRFARAIAADGHHRRLPDDLRVEAYQVARAATRAANASENWRWTWR